MAMNRRGIFQILVIALAVVIIIVALAFAPAVRDMSQDVRNGTAHQLTGTVNGTALNCANATISNFDNASCNYVDYFPSLFIGFLIFVAGAIAVGRLVI